MSTWRTMRVFVSSTFRDMQAEREELVKRVFPRLRRLCAERGVSWVEVDLRWGITEEQASRGDVLPICLDEIGRCRPFFLGLLGERYGWVPGPSLPPELLARHPWLAGREGDSVTELEVRHGVLNDPGQPAHAFFYFRAPESLGAVPDAERALYLEGPTEGEVRALGPEEAERRAAGRRERLARLKDQVRASGHPVYDGYRGAADLGERVLADWAALIGRLFPPGQAPDWLDREAAEHEAFARSRLGIHIGREELSRRLDDFAAEPGEGGGLVVLGESGIGKSALLANWAQRHREANPGRLVLYHALGATADSADGAALLRRLLGELRRKLGVDVPVPDGPAELQRAFVAALYRVAGRQAVLVLDGLNHLANRDGFTDLLWLPEQLPAGIRLIVSSLPCPALSELRKRRWPTLTVSPLTVAERRALIVEVLRLAGKALDAARLERLAGADASANPLFLRSVLEELRVFGAHERLDERINAYLAPRDAEGKLAPAPQDLFGRILSRYEADYERDRPGLVRDAMVLLWASRRGLEEAELLDLLGPGEGEPLPQAVWAPLYLAAEHALMHQSGRINFFHDHFRQAVQGRYLPSEHQRAAAHRRLADYFARREWTVRVRLVGAGELPPELAQYAEGADARVLDPRQVEELPWQLVRAGEWARLAEVLADLAFLDEAWKASRADVEAYWGQLSEVAPGAMPQVYRRVLDGPDRYLKYVDTVVLLLGFAGHEAEARRLSEHMIRHCREQEDSKELARHLHGLAVRLRRAEDLDGALVLHREEEAICRRLDDARGLALSLGGQAMVLRRRGDLDGAMALHTEEERIGQRLGEPVLLLSALNNQALVLREQGAPDEEVASLYRRVERLARQIHEPWILAHTLFSLALLACKPLMGRPRLSEEDLLLFFEQIFPLVEEANRLARNCYFRGLVERLAPVWEDTQKTVRNLGQALTSRGVGLFRRGDFEGALALYERAEDVYRRLGDLQGVGICLGERALVRMERGDLDGALELMRQEEQVCRRSGDIEGLAQCLGNQAAVLLHRGDVDAAEALLLTQERDCQGVEDPAIEARRLSYRASILEHRGDAAGALPLLRRQAELFRKADDAEGLATTLMKEAQLLADTFGRVEEAVPLAEEAAGLAREHGLEVLLGQIGAFLARARKGG